MKKFKLYSIISALAIVIIFSTAALCNQCAITPFVASETSASTESKASQTITETSATKEIEEAAVTGTSDVKETTSSNTDDALDTSKEAPTIKLKIYEGPTFSASDNVCYYRIEAVVTGDPAPAVEFSKDDSKGAFGSKKVQVNLTSGNPNYTLTAKAKNSAGEATDSITLSWGCGPVNNPPKIDTISLISNGTIVTSTQYDVTAFAMDPEGDNLSYEWIASGGVLKGSESNPVKWTTPDTAGTYNIGVKVSDGKGGEAVKSMNVNVALKPKTVPDIKTVKTVNLTPVTAEGGNIVQGDKAYPGGLVYVGDLDIKNPIRGYISYDTAVLSGATIESATLTFKVKGVLGNPSSLGELWIGVVDWGAHPIILSDFDLSGVPIQSFPASGDGNLTCNSAVLKSQLQNVANSGKTRFQIRIHFSVLTDDDSITDDWIYNQSDVSLNVTYTN